MKKAGAALLLLITTFFWGITFTIVKEAVARVDVFVFLAQRFALAWVILLAICLTARRPLSGPTLRNGCILGSCLFAAFAFQTVALQYTSASNTGFLTGLNVIFVPLLGACLFRLPVPPGVMIGAGLAVAGLFLLCTGGTWRFNTGDLLAAVCAVCVALHLLLTSRFSRRPGADVSWLTTIQVGTVSLLSAAAAFIGGKPLFVVEPAVTGALVLCALGATVFAFLVQTAMQRFISPAHTALIFCSEPVFAALYAWWAANERLGTAGLLGGGLILAGMLIAELMPERTAGGAATVDAAQPAAPAGS